MRLDGREPVSTTGSAPNDFGGRARLGPEEDVSPALEKQERLKLCWHAVFGVPWLLYPPTSLRNLGDGCVFEM
jgi:hypothetical protein